MSGTAGGELVVVARVSKISKPSLILPSQIVFAHPPRPIFPVFKGIPKRTFSILLGPSQAAEFFSGTCRKGRRNALNTHQTQDSLNGVLAPTRRGLIWPSFFFPLRRT